MNYHKLILLLFISSIRFIKTAYKLKNIINIFVRIKRGCLLYISTYYECIKYLF